MLYIDLDTLGIEYKQLRIGHIFAVGIFWIKEKYPQFFGVFRIFITLHTIHSIVYQFFLSSLISPTPNPLFSSNLSLHTTIHIAQFPHRIFSILHKKLSTLLFFPFVQVAQWFVQVYLSPQNTRNIVSQSQFQPIFLRWIGSPTSLLEIIWNLCSVDD